MFVSNGNDLTNICRRKTSEAQFAETLWKVSPMFRPLLSECTVEEGGLAFPSFPNWWQRHLSLPHILTPAETQIWQNYLLFSVFSELLSVGGKYYPSESEILIENIWNVKRLVWDAVQGWVYLTEASFTSPVHHLVQISEPVKRRKVERKS